MRQINSEQRVARSKKQKAPIRKGVIFGEQASCEGVEIEKGQEVRTSFRKCQGKGALKIIYSFVAPASAGRGLASPALRGLRLC